MGWIFQALWPDRRMSSKFPRAFGALKSIFQGGSVGSSFLRMFDGNCGADRFHDAKSWYLTWWLKNIHIHSFHDRWGSHISLPKTWGDFIGNTSLKNGSSRCEMEVFSTLENQSLWQFLALQSWSLSWEVLGGGCFRNPGSTHQLRLLVEIPLFTAFFYILSVVQEFFHQQYMYA